MGDKKHNFFKNHKVYKKIGSVHFVPSHELFPAQSRCSFLNVDEKMDKAVVSGEAVWNAELKKWECARHHGTSIFSRHKAFPVVVSPFGYVMIDGHHDVISSIRLQAEMIPVKIVADLSHLTEKQFWDEAEKKGWAYLYAIDGKRSLPPKNFLSLVDDSNRYFATITARKYFSTGPDTYTSVGAEYPLWVKVNKGIPFIELKISDVLSKAGFVYDAKLMGDHPDEKTIEKAREILVKVNIADLHVLPVRTYFKDIKAGDIVSIRNSEDTKSISSRRYIPYPD